MISVVQIPVSDGKTWLSSDLILPVWTKIKKRDIYAHLEIAGLERKRQLDRMQQFGGLVGNGPARWTRSSCAD